jgi:hypothetical protein
LKKVRFDWSEAAAGKPVGIHGRRAQRICREKRSNNTGLAPEAELLRLTLILDLQLDYSVLLRCGRFFRAFPF